MNERAKQKAEELIQKFDESLNHIRCGSNGIEVFLREEATKCAIICCDEVMSAVVTNGARWHEYNEIKKELLKM